MQTPIDLRSGRGHRAAALLFSGLFLLSIAGCDPIEPGPAEATIIGIVTNASGYGDAGEAASHVEGATVTAATVSATGQTTPLNVQTTTNAQGGYMLTVPGRTEVVIIEAVRGSARYAVLVEEEGASWGTTNVPPMTLESTAEADVYLHIRATAPGESITVSDVSALVSAEAAVALQEGRISVAALAATVRAAVDAEAAFAQTVEGGTATTQQLDAVIAFRTSAYEVFRHQVALAPSEQSRLTAIDDFYQRYIVAPVNVGLSGREQARAWSAAAGAAARSAGTAGPEGAFAATQRVRLFSAAAAGLAIEEAFSISGGTAAQMTALAAARVDFLTTLRTATSAQGAAAATAAYRTVVRTQLAGLLFVTQAEIDAVLAATNPTRAALDASVAASATAEEVALAYATYFDEARHAVNAALGGDGVLATEIIILLMAL